MRADEGALESRLKETEERLRLAEEQLRELVASAPIGVYRSTVEGRILDVNAAFARMLGYASPEEVKVLEMGRDVYFDPSDREALLAHHQESTESTNSRVRFKRRDGTPFWVALSFRRSRDASGATRHFDGFVSDIDDRVKAEEELLKTKEFLERAQEVARIGSWESEADEDGRLVWSRETCRIFGVDPAAFDGRVSTFFSRVHPDDLDAVRAASRAALAGRARYRIDHRIVRPEGRVRWVREEADVITDAEGRPARMVGTCQDITERKKLEEELRQAQKMEAVGRLAGGVAHDFNNILTAILGYVDLLADRLEGDADGTSFLEEVKSAAERAARLTGQLLAFGRKQVLQLQVLSMNELVADMEEMLRRLVGESIEVRLSLEPRPLRIRADASQIEQVMIDLAVNAKEAMPQGGRLTIRTSYSERSGTSDASLSMPGGRYVVLEVADNGVGMDADTRVRVFEPFFTTKSTGRGPGLGLATVYGIVRQSDGFVFVESEEGEGTTFRIYLPLVEDEITEGVAEGGALEAEPVRAGAATVLLVEDESSVRLIVRRTLEGAGYRVLEAASGAQALERAGAHAEIDLLLTDVVMPGMSGRILADKLHELRPETEVLFISGYTDDAVVRHGVRNSDAHFLQKPFTSEGLLTRIDRILFGGRRTR